MSRKLIKLVVSPSGRVRVNPVVSNANPSANLLEFIVFIALFFSVPAHADRPRVDPYTYASRLTGVPLKLLVAVSKVESGYYPYALNVGGAPVFPRNYRHARAVLERVGSNVDIGLMQVNHGIWGRRLNLSKEALLDPHTNVLAGAYILKRLLR